MIFILFIVQLLYAHPCGPRLRIHIGDARPLFHASVSKDHWRIDGQPEEELTYNSVFVTALGRTTIEDHVTRRRAEGHSTHALDLFGSAVYSRSPDRFDSLTGVRLEPLPSLRVPPAYRELNHRREILGDLMSSRTWVTIDRSMAARGIAAFDVITIRPAGPLLEFAKLLATPAEGRFFTGTLTILDRAWRRLSPNGGMLLAEFPEDLTYDDRFQSWVSDLRGKGVDLKIYSFGRMKLTRTLSAPARLHGGLANPRT